MNCYVFIEIFEFFKRSVETLCNLHNSLDAFICECNEDASEKLEC